MNCPKCGEFMSEMSGVKFDNHAGNHFYLCFKCKCWYNDKGEFQQTI